MSAPRPSKYTSLPNLRARVAELETELLQERQLHDVTTQLHKHACSEADRLRARVEELEAQLPDGMKHCTIIFKECEKGHGRLTAANWVDNGCEWCQLAKVEARAERAEASEKALLEAVRKIAEDDYPEDDQRGTWDQPVMIWQAVARAAITQSGVGAEQETTLAPGAIAKCIMNAHRWQMSSEFMRETAGKLEAAIAAAIRAERGNRRRMRDGR